MSSPSLTGGSLYGILGNSKLAPAAAPQGSQPIKVKNAGLF